MALTAATSPSSLRQSSTGRFDCQIACYTARSAASRSGVSLRLRCEVAYACRSINDQERNRRDLFHVLLSSALGDGVAQFVKEHMSFAIQHFITLQDYRVTNRLGQMTFTDSAWTKKQNAFAFRHESRSGKVKDTKSTTSMPHGSVLQILAP
jgi:hypothetical protein